MANEFRHGLSALAAPGLAEEIGRFTGEPRRRTGLSCARCAAA